MRIGAKKRPFYRVVVVDERAKRTGAYLELLGTYNPLTEPKDIKLKQDRIDHWTKQGAQMSTGFLRIIGKAPQRLPRKPKKEKKEEQPAAISPQIAEKTETAEPTSSEQPADEQKTKEAPAKEVESEATESVDQKEAEAPKEEIKNEGTA